jgi:hypothetical protein
MALNVKKLQKYAKPIIKEFYESEYCNDNYWANKPLQARFEYFMRERVNNCCISEALPFCCAVREITHTKYEYYLYKEIIDSIAHGDKVLIHISDKPEQDYKMFLDAGFEVKKKFMGNHKKMLTWLELDLTGYTL